MRSAILAGAIAFFGLLAALYLMSQFIETPITTDDASAGHRTVVINGASVVAEVVDTPERRAKGLSGREGLAEGTGMLFVFPEDGKYGFWMKDMRFSIDMIWIAHDGSVVHIEENVPPESYPASFTPAFPARYVLEVPAGFAEEHDISLGSKASF